MALYKNPIVYVVRKFFNYGEGHDHTMTLFSDPKKARAAYQKIIADEHESDFFKAHKDDKAYEFNQWDTLDMSYFNLSNGVNYVTVRFYPQPVIE